MGLLSLIFLCIQVLPMFSFRNVYVKRNVAILQSRSKINMGIIDSFKKIVSSSDKVTSPESLSADNDKQLRIYMQSVEKVNSLEEYYEKLSDEQLRAKTEEFRERLKNGQTLDSLLPDAFAVVREASWRVLELRHFDVQLIGGMALHDGRLAEMATGEGKTLVAILPVYLNALIGQSAYVVTASDYLAKRDGELMGQVYKFLGLSVGILQSHYSESERRQAYNADVTYLSNQQLGFDFLRDNLALSMENVVQIRPFSYCVVDEADSILIDEARVPLIISRKAAGASPKYVTAAKLANSLIKDKHYTSDIKKQKIELTEQGIKLSEQVLGKSLFDLLDPWAYFLLTALKAKEFLQRDQQYIVSPTTGEISIIDAFSGRVLDGRRFSDGMQQAVEAKENVKISGETQIVAKVSFQSLFTLFPKLSGMTGTALTDAVEFFDVYALRVLPIPTALPIARRDNPDAIFRTKAGKMKTLLKNVLSNHEKGRPILIGTTSIESSEEMVKALEEIKLTNIRLLNARPENIEKENEIVAQAGRIGAITVATNMAGRGTDIILGGSAKAYAKAIFKYLLLHKTGHYTFKKPQVATVTDPAYYASVLEGGNSIPESLLQYPSMESLIEEVELYLPLLPSKESELDMKEAIDDYLQELDAANTNKLPITRYQMEDLVAELADGLISAQSTSAFKTLRNSFYSFLKQFESVLKEEKEDVLKLGGLYVVGTARHENRRIDNQLRGRAGRQGDPGASRFFLSLEDDLFKIFGGEKLSGMMENFRVPEDMPIESPMVSQALDNVQTQVEEYYRNMRIQVYKIDEVLAFQRNAIYTERRSFLKSTEEDMVSNFRGFCTQTMEEIFSSAVIGGNKVNANKLVTKAVQFFPNMDLQESMLEGKSNDQILKLLKEKVETSIQNKRREIDSASNWSFVNFFRYLVLVQIDESWCKHLTRLDLLQEESFISAMVGENKDIMGAYRENAGKLFAGLLDDVRRNTVYSLFIYKPTK